MNRHKIPQKELIQLNDGDLIGVGGNYTAEKVRTSALKYYVFKVQAPETWAEQDDNVNDEEGIDFIRLILSKWTKL